MRRKWNLYTEEITEQFIQEYYIGVDDNGIIKSQGVNCH